MLHKTSYLGHKYSDFCWIVVYNVCSLFVRYGVEQVAPKVIVTSQHLLPKLMKILSSFPNEVNHIIYIEHPITKTPDVLISNYSSEQSLSEEDGMKTHQPNIIPFSKVELNGIAAKEDKATSKPGKMIS